MREITPERRNSARWKKAWELLQEIVDIIADM
jgi:hypothetical protein